VTRFVPGPSGPPVQSMGGRGRSAFLLVQPPAGRWVDFGRGGGHTDAWHVYDGVAGRSFVAPPRPRSWIDRLLRRRPRFDTTPLPNFEPRWEYCWFTSGGNPPFLNAAAPALWPGADHPQANVYVDDEGNERPIGTPGAWRAFTGEVASELRAVRPEPQTADEAQAELASALGRVLRRRMGIGP
jgi:hypothetical protein